MGYYGLPHIPLFYICKLVLGEFVLIICYIGLFNREDKGNFVGGKSPNQKRWNGKGNEIHT